MSFKGELENTRKYLRASREAILGRGGEISATAGLKDLPEATFNIPADTSLAFYADSSVAYQKTVPANVRPSAMVKQIGGMTRKCTNLFGGEALADSMVASMTNAVKNTENKTVTFTASGAKLWEFTEVKPNTQYTVILYGQNKTATTNITNIRISYSDGTTSDSKFDTMGENSYSVKTSAEGKTVTAIKGVTGAGTTILQYEKCGIFEGVLTVDDFEPYFDGLRSAKTTELKSHGANLLGGEALANSIKSAIPSATIDTVNKTITFIANDAGKWSFTDVKPATRYTVILYGYNKYVHDTVGKGTNLIIRYADGSGGTELRFELANEPSYSVQTSRANTDVSKIGGINYGGTTVLYYEKCGIFEGILTKEDFKEYVGEIDTFAISEAIRALEGYGEGNPDNPAEYNYIDFDGFFVGKGRIVDGVWVAYEEIQRTDISHLLPDKFINIEGGGTITAVNEYEYAVPSTIKYVRRVGG